MGNEHAGHGGSYSVGEDGEKRLIHRTQETAPAEQVDKAETDSPPPAPAPVADIPATTKRSK